MNPLLAAVVLWAPLTYLIGVFVLLVTGVVAWYDSDHYQFREIVVASVSWPYQVRRLFQ